MITKVLSTVASAAIFSQGFWPKERIQSVAAKDARTNLVVAGNSLATCQQARRLEMEKYKILYNINVKSMHIVYQTPRIEYNNAILPVYLDKRDMDNWDIFHSCYLPPRKITLNKRKRFVNMLYWSFDEEPLEDGYSHPAEDIIADWLLSSKEIPVLDWLMDVCLNTSSPSLAASVMRCLGRQVDPGTALWRTMLIREGLASDNLEIRDATVQAAELWGGTGIKEILRLHTEPVPWLREYISDILDDLAET